MSLPYTKDDVLREHRMNLRFYAIRKGISNYFHNLVGSTKYAAKLLGASVASCMHGIFPSCFKYTTLSVCLSIVENDLMHNRIPIPIIVHAPISDSAHMHDI